MWTIWLPHVIGIFELALIAGTVVAVRRWHDRPLKPGEAVAYGLLALLLLLLFLALVFPVVAQADERSWMTWEVTFFERSRPLCWRPVLLIGLCTAVLWGSLPRRPRVRWGALLLAVLCLWGTYALSRTVILAQKKALHLPHGHLPVSYTLNPALADMVTRGRLFRVRRVLTGEIAYATTHPQFYPQVMINSAADRTRYPAGWLLDTAFWHGLPKNYQEMYISTVPYFQHEGIVRTHPQWHTVLTGFYTIEEVPTGVWYPGGRLQDGLSRLEYRERRQ
jgi:hypothetical protein